MMKSRKPRTAFTLVELLVVIGIVALLISILMPALGRAREAANNVKCMSNLRQVFIATRLYASMHKGYMMPQRAGVSFQRNAWWGTESLGLALGLKPSLSTTNSQSQADMDRIGQYTQCPSNTQREIDPGQKIRLCYTYNYNMGDYRRYSTPPDLSRPQYLKLEKVPANVVIACDIQPVITNGDDGFNTLNELTFKYHRGGIPHNKMCNMLFNDGTVHRVNIWAPGVKPPYEQTATGTDSSLANPLLKSWMFEQRFWDKNNVVPF